MNIFTRLFAEGADLREQYEKEVERLYVEMKMTCDEIAKMVGQVSSTSINKLLHRRGVQLRPAASVGPMSLLDLDKKWGGALRELSSIGGKEYRRIARERGIDYGYLRSLFKGYRLGVYHTKREPGGQ